MDYAMINKEKKRENMPNGGLCRPGRPQNKNFKKWNERQVLARELKKLWNIRVAVMSWVIGALRTVPKGLEIRLEELEIEGRPETIQTTASIRLAWKLPRF